MKTKTTERSKRQWWAVNDHDVKLVTGYFCSPNYPKDSTYWWIPELGLSMAEGIWLFETEREALDKAIEELQHTIADAQDNLNTLQCRWQNLADAAKESPPAPAE